MLAGIGRPVWGLVAGHTLVAVPYVLRTTLAVLQNFDRRVEEAAAMLGAPPARVFFEVTLPLIRPGVIAGGIFAFIVSFDQLPISLFLVVPGGETLPVVLLNYIRFDLDGAIAAASMVSIVLALSAVLLLERIIGLRAYVEAVESEGRRHDQMETLAPHLSADRPAPRRLRNRRARDRARADRGAEDHGLGRQVGRGDERPDHPGLREGIQMQGRDRLGLPVLSEAAGDAEERAAL